MSRFPAWNEFPRALALAAVLATSVSVMSADHAESPGADADPSADLADVFIFPSPQNAGRTVAAITFGGRSAPRSRIDGDLSCDRNVIYTFHIDREVGGNFDNVPDVSVHARFARNARGECGIQLENVPGAGTVSGPIETVNEASGIKFFAGARNDPFFFDAEGYAALVASFAAPGQSGDLVGAFRLGQPAQPRRDSFAARNVSAIVFEMDNGALTAGGSSRVRVWATTGRIAG
jgi:hypothetical protein